MISREVKDNDSANAIRIAVQDFYGNWAIWGSLVEVTKLNVNAAFETVTDPAEIVAVNYHVKVRRAIAGVGFSQAQIIKPVSTTSHIVIGAPYQHSSPPMEGNFAIACQNPDGNEFVTREMSIWESVPGINMYMHWDIPHLQLKLYVEDSGKYIYRPNGISLRVIF